MGRLSLPALVLILQLIVCENDFQTVILNYSSFRLFILKMILKDDLLFFRVTNGLCLTSGPTWENKESKPGLFKTTLETW